MKKKLFKLPHTEVELHPRNPWAMVHYHGFTWLQFITSQVAGAVVFYTLGKMAAQVALF